MLYTVQQLAKQAGVSVRTLHYYDTIGLLKPASLAENGYRRYGHEEVLRLQQILFFRELDFSLSDIKRIMQSPGFNAITSLEDQKQLLLLKQKRLRKIIKTLDKTITHMTNADNDTAFEEAHAFSSLSDDQIAEYKKEVYQKYDPALVRQSVDRVKKWGKAGLQQVQAEGSAIIKTIYEHMTEGYDAPAVQTAISQYHQHINRFYDCSLEIFRNLGAMYETDPRFAKNYNVFHPDMPRFMHQAIEYYCDQKK